MFFSTFAPLNNKTLSLEKELQICVNMKAAYLKVLNLKQ